MTSLNMPRAATSAAVLAALLAFAAPATATTLTLFGTTDSGPLARTGYTASVTFADVAAGFDGSVALTSLSIDFAGSRWTLADAAAGASLQAWFSGGTFIGIEYSSAAPASVARPIVQFAPGFSSLGEANFAYDTTGAGFQGYAGVSVAAVPEPGTMALWLAGVAFVGAGARLRRSRGARALAA